MSWVLILTTDGTMFPPAVIGGYPSREEAEAAGHAATEVAETAALTDSHTFPEFTAYTVIPGAACAGPLGGTYSRVHKQYDYDTKKMVATRRTHRWP